MTRQETNPVSSGAPETPQMSYIAQKMLEALDRETDWDEVHRQRMYVESLTDEQK